MRRLVLGGISKGMDRLREVGLALERALMASFSATRVLSATNLIDLQALRAGKLERLHDAMGQVLLADYGALDNGVVAEPPRRPL